jgi:hypothetical protein
MTAKHQQPPEAGIKITSAPSTFVIRTGTKRRWTPHRQAPLKHNRSSKHNPPQKQRTQVVAGRSATAAHHPITTFEGYYHRIPTPQSVMVEGDRHHHQQHQHQHGSKHRPDKGEHKKRRYAGQEPPQSSSSSSGPSPRPQQQHHHFNKKPKHQHAKVRLPCVDVRFPLRSIDRSIDRPTNPLVNQII